MVEEKFILRFENDHKYENVLEISCDEIPHSAISNLTDILVVTDGVVSYSKKAERVVIFIKPKTSQFIETYNCLKKNDISSISIIYGDKSIDFSVSWKPQKDGSNKYQHTEIVDDMIRISISSN